MSGNGTHIIDTSCLSYVGIIFVLDKRDQWWRYSSILEIWFMQ